MKQLSIYHPTLPPVLGDLAQTGAVQRLKQVGMNCGCEYTSFPRFARQDTYSRFDHSLGVGLIVWHFTHDAKQAAAGLLHDISTPVFAHVVDFMNGDYLTQESTELDTRAVILSSAELLSVLEQHGLSVEEVCDYHRYPIADNDTPQLSADRLEYTLGNAVNYGFCDTDTARAMYDDLTVGTNEQGQPELVFRTPERALQFAEAALCCSKVYVSDEDRYAMEALAQLLNTAVSCGLLCRDDLMTTEPEVIAKLCADDRTAAAWARFRGYDTLETVAEPQAGCFCCRVDAKKRHIDPLVLSEGRVSAVFPSYRAALRGFLQTRFDGLLCGRSSYDNSKKD